MFPNPRTSFLNFRVVFPSGLNWIPWEGGSRAHPHRTRKRPNQTIPGSVGDGIVKVKFTEDGIAEIAEMAALINERTENIGARRLYTMMEKLLMRFHSMRLRCLEKTW